MGIGFSFDDGLAEQQGPFLTVARPILAALMNLDTPPNDEGEGGPDPEVVREMLEDALVLLGNANARLNVWRQRRFSDYLTDLGKRTERQIGICSHTSSMRKLRVSMTTRLPLPS